MKQFIQKWQTLLSASALVVICDALDIISTSCVMAFVPGSTELNAAMRDPGTFKFVLAKGLAVKGLAYACLLLPSVTGLQAITRNQLVASLPLVYYVYQLLPVVFNNFLLAMQG